MKYKKFLACCLIFIFHFSCIAQLPVPKLQAISYQNIIVSGELSVRLQQNYNRLESSIYTPSTIFPTSKLHAPAEWPGDIEGRLILGLVLEAQATHREPKYLAEIIRLLPSKVNAGGYFGPIQKDTINEQQLSGNGWFLRGLCEYYRWKKDPKIKAYITDVIVNLALPTRSHHRIYPIDPNDRNRTVGAASGTTQATVGKWKLSSDIGCDFIFLDGVVQAYEIIPSVALQSLIEEMIHRFLQMDLKAMNAQTHASLTGLRSIVRYYTNSKQRYLLKEVRKRYDLYRSYAMTANYENFNWFGRPEWTEPCAIVDSYMLAVQLWQLTGDPIYLEDAHQIYFNAIANTQRANGGFGLSNCTRPNFNSLQVEVDEATWCCTMRGAEGLASAVRYNYFNVADQLYAPFFCSSDADIKLKNGEIKIKQVTDYPFKGSVKFEIMNTSIKSAIHMNLIAPSWTKHHQLRINGKEIPIIIKNGFISFYRKLYESDVIDLTFKQATIPSNILNKKYNLPDFYTLKYGPLLLGLKHQGTNETSFSSIPVLKRINNLDWNIVGTNMHLSPVYHLLDTLVTKKSGYAKQILFKIGNQN